MEDLSGKVVVITGAASGIGKAMALSFARRGMKVVAADIEAEALKETAREIEAVGGESLTHLADVSKAEAVNELADAAWNRFGAVHVLCNNAGVASFGPMAGSSIHDWQWVLGVNLWGVIHGIGAFLPRMIAQNQPGHVVNTASIAGMVTMPNAGAYNASKYAVVAISETLQKEMAGHPIGVSVLCPLWVDTGIFESERNRPGELHVEREQINIRERAQATPWSWLTPQQVSERVIDAILQDRLYVFTHPETGPLLESRFQEIREAYPKPD